MKPTNSLHHSKVTRIQKRILEVASTGQKAKMFHGSTNSTRPLIDPTLATIDVSDLTDIIEINTEKGYVIAEPNVPLDALVAATTVLGYVPPMVAEFPGITVGGAVQGGSGESSSHKYGLFSDTCLQYEVVLGDGSTVTCSRTQQSDLFAGLSCAFGSLGVLTAVKVQLVPAKKYVAVTYIPTNGYDETITILKQQVEKGFEFVDAIQFSKDKGVVVVGEYAHKKTGPVAKFMRAHDEWFYLHVEKQLAKNVYQESVPLTDYLFRYDRGGFWVAKYGFNGTHVPFNRISRFLLAGLFKTRTLFKLLHSSGYSHKYLAQDVCLPQESVTAFLKYNDDMTNIYPLWICPLKPTADKLAPTALDTKLIINVGIWGEPTATHKDFKTINRDIEKKVRQIGGRKVLYAHAYYTEKEYWSIYDKPWYDTLRTTYHAEKLFPDVYLKTQTKPLTQEPSRRRALIKLLKLPYRTSS